MKNLKLSELLATQDMGKKGIDQICDAVLSNTFDYSKDPLTGIIVNAFESNDYSDYESMVTDLSYAINQLSKAKAAIEAAQ